MFGCEVGPMSIFSQALAGLARLSSFQHRFVFVKKLNANRLVRPLCAAIALGASLVSAGAQTAPSASLQQQLQAIFDMSAEDMAATSAFTKRAYEAQLAHIYRIQNKQIRDIVLEFVLNPKATAFEQAATQSWLASPGSGWKSHHAYPGGLSVHNLEWLEFVPPAREATWGCLRHASPPTIRRLALKFASQQKLVRYLLVIFLTSVLVTIA